jgi:hypothetical protein
MAAARQRPRQGAVGGTAETCKAHRVVSEAVLRPGHDAAALYARLFDTGGAVRQTPFQDRTLCMRHPVAGHRVSLIRSTASGAGCRERAARGAYDAWEVVGFERNQLADFEKRLRKEVRTACPCSGNAREFFEALGHTCDVEFVRRGMLIETSAGLEIRAMQFFLDAKDAQVTPEATLASAEKKTTAPGQTAVVPWLLELSGEGKTPEARALVGASILKLLKDLRGMVSIVFAAVPGKMGDPIKYQTL